MPNVKIINVYSFDELSDSAKDNARDWFFYALRDDYEYQYSDEAVDENITINEYQFDGSGHIA